MSKATEHRKSNLKKPSIDERFDDQEAHHQRPCYKYLQEKQRKLLATNQTQKLNNQLDMIREILFYQQNIRDLKPNKNTSMNSTSEENRSVRLSRTEKKDDQQSHPKTRSISIHSPSNAIRSRNNISDISKSGQLKQLLDRLWSDLIDLELITGHKPNKNNLSSNTSTAALATALLTLTGHVKQYTSDSNIREEINNLKDQLSVIIKNQFDFQEKIENQMITLQTMLQAVCQLVNNEIIPNKSDGLNPNWLSNAQRPYLIPKDTYNAMDELLMFTRRMNNGTPIDPSNNRQLVYSETSNKLSRPISAISAFEITGNGNRNIDQESHSPMISPLNTLEYRFLNENPTINVSQNRNGGTLTADDSILEKIFQERRRLVQQMAQLNKQHEMTQEELANLEAKTVQ